MVFPFPVLPPNQIQSPPYQTVVKKNDATVAVNKVGTIAQFTLNTTPITTLNVQAYNRFLSMNFDLSVKNKNLKPFLDIVQAQLPSLTMAKSTQKIEAAQSQVLKNNNLQLSNHDFVVPMDVELSPNGMIQIFVEGKPLFISSERLAERIETKANASIVGSGIRGLDPCSQLDWKTTPLEREWPPSKQQAVTRYSDVKNKALYFETPINADYQVKTSGMVALIPDESSVVWAYEQNNMNPTKTWGAWTIAPLDVPAGKRVVNAYPASQAFSKTYAHALNKEGQWQYNADKGVVIVHPEKAGNFLDPFDDSTSWTLHAIEGNKYAIVLRTIYKDAFVDKAKSCMVEGKATYVENEFMGPKVSKGQSSIVSCRLDILPLSTVTGDPKSVFEKARMDEQVLEVVDYLQEKTKNK
jgi:hypothetical protein